MNSPLLVPFEFYDYVYIILIYCNELQISSVALAKYLAAHDP